MICVRYLETVDCRIFVIRSPWLWRYAGEGVNLESAFVKSALRSLDGDKYHFCCTYREGWYCGSQSSGTRLKKIGLGKVHLFPNNSIPPAGPSWLPSYLWQPTKLVRVISGYPEWRLSPAGGRSTSGETWLGAEVGTPRGFLTFLQSACSHESPQIVS